MHVFELRPIRFPLILGLAYVLLGPFWQRIARGAVPWVDERTAGPFVCRSEFPLDEIARLVWDLRRLQAELIEQLGVSAAKEPIELYFFRKKSTYTAYLARHFPKAPSRRALYIKVGGLGKVFAFRAPTLEVDVRHECTHALLHAALPIVPLWLDEGLAGYFEVAPERQANNNPYQNDLRSASVLESLPKLEELEKKEAVVQMGRGEYRAAWAWVHFLLHDSAQSRAELLGYLTDLGNGATPEPLSQRIRLRFPNVGPRFASHFWNVPHDPELSTVPH